MKTLERLKAVRDYFDNPDHWTQGVQYFKPKDRDPKYCLLGAVFAYNEGTLGRSDDRFWEKTHLRSNADFEDIAEAMGFYDWYDAAEFNNHHTHGELLDRLDRAIEKVTA